MWVRYHIVLRHSGNLAQMSVSPFAPTRRIMDPMNNMTPRPLPKTLDMQRQVEATQAFNRPASWDRDGGCVHCEHSHETCFVAGDLQLEQALVPAQMSGYRLLICLAIVGWSVRDLARRLGRHQTSVIRWANGSSPIPGEVAA